MKEAKINLSKEEMELVLNKDWLYLKRSVIDKGFEFLGRLHDEYNSIATEKINELAYLPIDKMGKIARGENLQGLPYLMMDYPALFNKNKIIAVRTLFWWGNFFSISLHLSGFKVLPDDAIPWIEYFKSKGFYINVSRNEWNYDFNEDGFIPFTNDKTFYSNVITENNLLRVSKKASLADWSLASRELILYFEEIISFLAVNFPAGEKDLLPGFPKASSHL